MDREHLVFHLPKSSATRKTWIGIIAYFAYYLKALPHMVYGKGAYHFHLFKSFATSDTWIENVSYLGYLKALPHVRHG